MNIYLGAAPNKRASNGFDALNAAISVAEYILDNDTVRIFTIRGKKLWRGQPKAGQEKCA